MSRPFGGAVWARENLAFKTLNPGSKVGRVVVLVFCSSDAIIPMWAYMLVTTYAQDFATEVYYGDEEAYLTHHYKTVIGQIDLEDYKEKRIVIKGCSDQPVPAGAYLELTKRLKPHVLSLMFGEPCSTVPIYKRPRK